MLIFPPHFLNLCIHRYIHIVYTLSPFFEAHPMFDSMLFSLSHHFFFFFFILFPNTIKKIKRKSLHMYTTSNLFSQEFFSEWGHPLWRFRSWAVCTRRYRKKREKYIYIGKTRIALDRSNSTRFTWVTPTRSSFMHTHKHTYTTDAQLEFFGYSSHAFFLYI